MMAKTPTKEMMEPDGASIQANDDDDDDLEERIPLRFKNNDEGTETAGIIRTGDSFPEEEEIFDVDEFDAGQALYHIYHSPATNAIRKSRSGRRHHSQQQVPTPPPSTWLYGFSIRDILGFIAFLLLLIVGLWNIKLATDMNSNEVAVAPAPAVMDGEGGIVTVGTATTNKHKNDYENEDSSPTTTSSSDDLVLLIAQFRQRFGDIAYDVMMDYCQLEEGTKTMYIGPFVDLVNDIIDNIGIRGLYDDVFNVYGFTIALRDAFYRNGLSPSKINVIMEDGHQGPETRIRGRPCDKKIDISFWHKHWVGAIAADKLLREGSLRISSRDNSRINDAPGYFQEVYRLTSSRHYPDIVPYHSVHGFWWQYVATIRPNLTEYPTDLFQSLCAPWLTEDDANEFSHNSMYRECRHGVGHAVFYAMHLRQIGASSLDVRNQNVPESLDFTDEALCEGQRICNGAPKDDELCHEECWSGGFHHSMKLFRKTEDQGEAIFRGKQSCDGIHFD